jgi:phospholipid/cholesterol/gamma-HCH transport system permease protein
MNASNANFTLDQTSPPVLRAQGEWKAEHIDEVDRALNRLEAAPPAGLMIDIADVSAIDTAGVLALCQVIEQCGTRDILDALQGANDDQRALFALVWENLERCRKADLEERSGSRILLERLGRGVEDAASDVYENAVFLGRTIVALGHSLANPHRIRWASTFHVMEHAGVNALPIVAILSFFVGAVVAYLGANLLQQFGADAFAVELVAFAVLREFGIIITAILIAGRSDSAFTAQIGSMRMQQEIDAMKVMGLDIYHALVIPRVIACMIMLPLLTFAAMVTGILGGMLVLWASLDLSPAFFFARMADQVSITQFWAGMAKAPVFALVIAIIGCRQGMQVENNVESLGRNVTASVVQSIFAVIVIDALFAMAYLELGI